MLESLINFSGLILNTFQVIGKLVIGFLELSEPGIIDFSLLFYLQIMINSNFLHKHHVQAIQHGFKLVEK
jgi:hypothetical protein